MFSAERAPASVDDLLRSMQEVRRSKAAGAITLDNNVDEVIVVVRAPVNLARFSSS
jgi:hypothetical protein